MAKISLCMIVRDEEALLGGCLASVRGAVDEVIVVDTGSRDGTKRVAQEAGARVYDFAWCNDFAKARNESLRRARGEWVLVLDADERLAPGSAARLRHLVHRAKFDLGMLRLHDATRLDASAEDVLSGRAREAEVQLVPRLLRNTDGLAYVDPVHENVTPWLKRRGMRMVAVEVDIIHLGATLEIVVAKGKIERNVRLLETRIERNQADVEAYGYLAHEHLRAGALDDAYEVTARGWVHVGSLVKGSPSLHRLATARAHVQVVRGQYREARETMRVAHEVEGDNPDFAFLLAYTYESEAIKCESPAARREMLESARDGYRACLDLADRVYVHQFVVGASSWYGAIRLGTVELQLGRPAEALRAFESALAAKPDKLAARLGKAEAALDLGDTAGALAQLEKLLDEKPDAWILAACAVAAMGRPTETQLFVRRAMALLPNGLVAQHRALRLRDLVSGQTTPSDSAQAAAE